jgi:hypothetical protein
LSDQSNSAATPLAHKAFGADDALGASLPLSIRSLPRPSRAIRASQWPTRHCFCPPLPVSDWPFADNNQNTDPNKDAQ